MCMCEVHNTVRSYNYVYLYVRMYLQKFQGGMFYNILGLHYNQCVMNLTKLLLIT